MSTKKQAFENNTENPFDLNRMAQNWGEVMRLSGEVARELAEKNEKQAWEQPSFDPFNLQSAWTAVLERMMEKPQDITQVQIEWWQNYLKIWDGALTRLAGGSADDVIERDPTDRRFKNEAWTRDASFAFIRQAYMLGAQYFTKLIAENSDTLSAEEAKKLAFFTRAGLDALSPTNFVLTNPDVLLETQKTGGENILRGMKNMLEDMKRGSLQMTDETAFEVGKNIATTPGQVIFRNRLMEVIHYMPAGDTTFETPLLIVPPWINKYYILDLRPDNSLVRWALEQGHAVFMVSWVNPDANLRDVNFEDYMHEGLMAALDATLKQTGAPSANVIGYCIGGTLLTMMLAYCKAQKQESRIKSATFLTTLIDFENSGDLKLFVDEEQLTHLNTRMQKQGYMDAKGLQTTFNLLRANDLIWSFVINNYLLGRAHMPFDLLYWNSDSTNLPAAMHEFYLRHMYLNNDFKNPGGLTIDDTPLDVRSIDTPAYFLSTRDDHIAPWTATYAGAQLFKGPVAFTLSASGHIAGIVNPPASHKYCYWTNAKKAKNADAWMQEAKQHDGSWWKNWQEWITPYAGKKTKAINPTSGPLTALCPAPGTYVKVKA